VSGSQGTSGFLQVQKKKKKRHEGFFDPTPYEREGTQESGVDSRNTKLNPEMPTVYRSMFDPLKKLRPDKLEKLHVVNPTI